MSPRNFANKNRQVGFSKWDLNANDSTLAHLIHAFWSLGSGPSRWSSSFRKCQSTLRSISDENTTSGVPRSRRLRAERSITSSSTTEALGVVLIVYILDCHAHYNMTLTAGMRMRIVGEIHTCVVLRIGIPTSWHSKC